MARLANTANLGYVPLPDAAAAVIHQFIARPTHPVRIFDPCAGEGRAIGTIAQGLAVPPSAVYANELHDERARACEAYAAHVACCDTLKSLQATRNFAQLAYLNPPFEQDGREEGGGRLEPKFFHRCIEDGHWLQAGGVVVMVTPQDVLRRRACLSHLARCYDQVTIYALPDAIRHFREAVVFGVLREQFRTGSEQHTEAARLLTILDEALPVLTPPAAPHYTLPLPLPLRKRITWRDGSHGTPALAQEEVVATCGAWRSKDYQAARAGMRREQLAPLFPLHKTQAALRIAAGAINGTSVEIGGVPQIVKGSTIEEQVTWTEERDTDSSHIQETHKVVRRVPHVVTVDGQGTIRQFIGDQGMAALMANDGTATALLKAVEDAAPPRYRLDMEPAVAAVLTTIISASGRALPGYPPGLLPMQQHVAAGVFRALTTPDPGWNGQTPRAVTVAAEMGVGKTSIAIAIAELFRRQPRRTRRS